MRRLLDAWAHIVDPRTLPITVTILLFCALFGFGSVMYTGLFLVASAARFAGG
jgi:hypothetical protein